MSKRRSDQDHESLVSDGTLMRPSRSIRACTNQISDSLNSANIFDDQTSSLSQICKFLEAINEYKNVENNKEENIAKAHNLLRLHPDENDVRMLKYVNQTIVIPIFNDNNQFKLQYNSKFPFLREPMSISSQSDYFINNIGSFRHFKKIILKNARIQMISQSITKLPIDQFNLKGRFEMNCEIFASDGRSIQCKITEKILESANILLERPNVWNIAYECVNFDDSFNDEQKTYLFGEIWKNVALCFQMMENVEIGVSVDKQCNVHICNILHNYFTN